MDHNTLSYTLPQMQTLLSNLGMYSFLLQVLSIIKDYEKSEYISYYVLLYKSYG